MTMGDDSMSFKEWLRALISKLYEKYNYVPPVKPEVPPVKPEPVPEVPPVKPEVPPVKPEVITNPRFHHTQTNGPDGGKSLVLCPGDERMNFVRCECNGVVIPRHKDGDGRETYWNMRQAPIGDIVCETRDGKKYVYPATKVDPRGFVWGPCSGRK
jgi:hypothetical protein